MVSDRYAALIVLSHRTVDVKVPEGSTHMNVNSQSRHFYILHFTHYINIYRLKDPAEPRNWGILSQTCTYYSLNLCA